MSKINEGIMSSKDTEWETPKKFFNPLDKVFKFDLDPCATKKNTLCKKFFTKKEDGLKQEWKGNVFVNPPYSRQVSKWVKKAILEFNKGANILMLVAARTDTDRFHYNIFPCAKAICFVQGRIAFLKNGKEFKTPEKKKNEKGEMIKTGRMIKGSPAFPSAFVWFSKKKLNSKQLDILKTFGKVY